MRLARLVLLRLPGINVREVSGEFGMTVTFEDRAVEAKLDPESNSTDRLVLRASTEISRDCLTDRDGKGITPLSEIRFLERAVAELIDILTVVTGTAVKVSSFRPEYGFYEFKGGELAFLESLGDLSLQTDWPEMRSIGAPSGLGLAILAAVDLNDRPDGVRLLAEAISSDHPTGRFRELCRLFERAFALGPHALVVPLTEFLAAYPLLGYDEQEVSGWLDNLRHLATHADRREQFAVASDVAPSLPRILFAAQDVLLNKSNWRNGETERRDVWSPPLAPTRGGVAVVQGEKVPIRWEVLDRFGVYPLWLGGDKTTIPYPSDWVPGRSSERVRGGDLKVVADSLRAPHNEEN
jgi:hypothetical protein